VANKLSIMRQLLGAIQNQKVSVQFGRNLNFSILITGWKNRPAGKSLHL